MFVASDTGVDAAGQSEADVLDATFAALVSMLESQPPRETLERCRRYVNVLAAVEAKTLAGFVTVTGDDRAARNLMRDDRSTSRREKWRKAKRAKTVAANASLGEQLGDGRLSVEQVDAIADAAERSGGAAATDPELIAQVASTDPDQGRKITSLWLADRARASEVNAEHGRQRRLRTARRGTTRLGLASVTLEGDQTSIEEMWRSAIRLADRYYRDDGGREVPADQHPRTAEQRLFDALRGLITSDGSASSSNDATQRTSRGGRPAAVIIVPWAKVAGGDDELCAQLLGSGPLPDDVVLEMLEASDLFVGITSESIRGQDLWLGRMARGASLAQFVALALRDRGCVKCQTSPERCQAHHLTPWNSPAKGETDIDKLALLCGPCHIELHERNLTLYRDPTTGLWKTRPATADETPPPRPSRSSGNTRGRFRSRRATQTPAPHHPTTSPALAPATFAISAPTKVESAAGASVP